MLRIDLIVRERNNGDVPPPLLRRPVIHDVNNSLPPVVERGMDHEGMSHAGRGGGGAEKDKDEILSLFFSSKLFASTESSRSADLRVLFGLG